MAWLHRCDFAEFGEGRRERLRDKAGEQAYVIAEDTGSRRRLSHPAHPLCVVDTGSYLCHSQEAHFTPTRGFNQSEAVCF